MGRRKKNEEDVFAYDLRAKVPKSLHDEVVEEASGRLLDKSQIVREAVQEYIERRRATRKAAKKSGKQG